MTTAYFSYAEAVALGNTLKSKLHDDVFQYDLHVLTDTTVTPDPLTGHFYSVKGDQGNFKMDINVPGGIVEVTCVPVSPSVVDKSIGQYGMTAVERSRDWMVEDNHYDSVRLMEFARATVPAMFTRHQPSLNNLFTEEAEVDLMNSLECIVYEGECTEKEALVHVRSTKDDNYRCCIPMGKGLFAEGEGGKPLITKGDLLLELTRQAARVSGYLTKNDQRDTRMMLDQALADAIADNQVDVDNLDDLTEFTQHVHRDIWAPGVSAAKFLSNYGLGQQEYYQLNGALKYAALSEETTNVMWEMAPLKYIEQAQVEHVLERTPSKVGEMLEALDERQEPWSDLECGV